MKKIIKITLCAIYINNVFFVQNIYAQSIDIIIPNELDISNDIINKDQSTHEQKILNDDRNIVIERIKIINNI